MRYVVPVCLLLVGCTKQAPTVSLTADPVSVESGQCATLTWSSSHATTVSIDQGVGKVEATGSTQVCPLTDTRYTIAAAGGGGSKEVSTTVGVTPFAAGVMVFPEAALFETGKAELTPEGKQKIEEYRARAQDQLTRADQVMITGYTDNVGGTDRNSELSQQRAEAVRDYLIILGANPQVFQVSGAGDARPIADNATEEGRAKNRRVEVAVLGAKKSGG